MEGRRAQRHNSPSAQTDVVDDGPAKPVQIWEPNRPTTCHRGGNSNGDLPMLKFAEHPNVPALRLLMLHDDPEREFDYVDGAEHALDVSRANGVDGGEHQERLKTVLRTIRRMTVLIRDPR